MKKKILVPVFVLLAGIGQLSARQTSLPTEVARLEFKARQSLPVAPEAAQLGKYGNVPVSLFTGTPQISIPLHEFKGQMLSLPISLSYNNGGFKPGEVAPWVGMGWSLNAGGVITRGVMGNPDINENYYDNGPLVLPPSSDVFAYQDFLKQMKMEIRDLQPDMYYYNFAGKSGKFMVLPDKSIVKKERDNLTITYNHPDEFVITDENGTTYRFASPEQTRMQLMDDIQEEAPPRRSYSYNSSWYLTSMVSVNNVERIDFTYESTIEGAISEEISQNRSVTLSMITTHKRPSGSDYSEQGSAVTTSPPFVWAKRKFLKSVVYSRAGDRVGSVELESVSNRPDSNFPLDKQLKSIKIYEGKLQKQYSLGYGFFGGPGSTSSQKRMHLDTLAQVLQWPASETPPPPYLFTYNEMGSPPERSTAGLDHWGFYNGYGNSSLVPAITFPNGRSVGDGALRNPNFSGSISGVLSRITYPTGGYTEFAYEQHDALLQDSSTRDVGGIRIREITDYSYASKKGTVKRYEYQLENGKTSGKSDNNFPRYDVTTSMHRWPPPIVIGGSEEQSTVNYTVSANSVYGMGAVQGSHIGYSRVTEYQYDFNNYQPLGKTVYQYHIGSIDQFDDHVGNGDLEKKSVYDNNDRLLSELSNTYTYQIIGNVPQVRVKLKAAQDNLTQWCKKQDANGMFTYEGRGVWKSMGDCLEVRTFTNILYSDGYTIWAQQKQLVQQTEKTFDLMTGNYLTSIRKMTYGSDKHTFPTQINDLTTNNEEVVTVKKYAGDYIGVNGSTAGIAALTSAGMYGTEIESIQYRQQTDGSNKRLISGLLTYYDQYQPVSTFRLEAAGAPDTWVTSSWGGNNLVTDSRYKPLASYKYSFGQIVEQRKDNDAPQAFAREYPDRYPVMVVNNALFEEIAYTGFEQMSMYGGNWTNSGGVFDLNSGHTGRYSLKIPVTGYLQCNLGASVTKPMVVSYWSKTGPLTVTQEGTTSVPLSTTGITRNGWTFYLHRTSGIAGVFRLSGTDAWIDDVQIYPADAQATTYTYEPGVGISSSTTPDNITTCYEYDALNRLLNVRDDKGNIVQNYTYNYGPGTPMTPAAQTLFYNAEVSRGFVKNDCTLGEPTTVNYRVKYGTHTSAVGQADADALANAEINARGQTYANAHGECLFYNGYQSGNFFKNDCPPENGQGMVYKYEVEARKWSSPVSQAAADQLALDDINTNGQAAANTYGTCSCAAEGKRFINGVCETGNMYYLSSVPENGKYRCTYQYQFSDGSTSQIYTKLSPINCVSL
ncbi:DUF5977 domain-containing protein [Chitinophaga qingshengii]|uniref:DUF5977 domain-containing protein n=1 Tax=Chitinophaga qingshengii TaxID=1569794 RepID=A0ABR7TFK8_9BACT|nr:DUF5977 domain-containing protein [Chitinophaga qingshengii]MBC9929138.1 hypothetical protein [Chitinophaga qingshengii]